MSKFLDQSLKMYQIMAVSKRKRAGFRANTHAPDSHIFYVDAIVMHVDRRSSGVLTSSNISCMWTVTLAWFKSGKAADLWITSETLLSRSCDEQKSKSSGTQSKNENMVKLKQVLHPWCTWLAYAEETRTTQTLKETCDIYLTFAAFLPSTNIMASITFDLPLPFGPMIALNLCTTKTQIIPSEHLLNEWHSLLFFSVCRLMYLVNKIQ